LKKPLLWVRLQSNARTVRLKPDPQEKESAVEETSAVGSTSVERKNRQAEPDPQEKESAAEETSAVGSTSVERKVRRADD